MAIKDLTDIPDGDIDNLIDIIATVHKTATRKIHPILSDIITGKKKNLTLEDWKIIKKWYKKPSKTKRRDNKKVAKVLTYVVIERLYPGQMEKNDILLASI